MKLLIGIIVALFAAVGIGMVLREDAGYVMLSIGPWTIETSVVFLVLCFIVAFIALYWLTRLLFGLWRAPRRLKGANARRLIRKSQRLLAKGVQAQAEGRWKAAEITLAKGAELSPAPALYYIEAARAAQQLGAPQRREGYLSKAAALPRKDDLLVELARAEFLLEDNQPGEAKTLLLQLHRQYPQETRPLELLVPACRAAGDWDSLRGTLAALRKRKASDRSEYAELQIQTFRELMSTADSVAELRQLWRQVPKELQHDETLIIEYAGQLRDHDGADEAEALLRDALRRRWSDRLVVGYGELGRGNAVAQLAAAETWLKEHGDNPYLLLTLGRLAKRSRSPDKARAYLEQSIKLLPMPDAYEELGEVLDEQGDKETASRCYRSGLRLLAKRPEEKEGVPVIEAQQALPGGAVVQAPT